MTEPAEQLPAAVDARRKIVATLTARLALRGVVLRVLEDDRGQPSYVASLGSMVRQFSDLGALKAWTDQVDGLRS